MTVAPSEPGVRQEEDLVRTRELTIIGLVGVFVTLLGIFIAGAILHVRSGSVRPPTPTSSLHVRRAPREIGIVDQTPIETAREGMRLRAAQREQLRHYGWVDRAHGVARIPIDRAMDLVVSQGVAAESPAPAGGAAAP